MIKFSEYVSLGHPDKTADYISQYILDRYIENDPAARYAVEVQIKDHYVTLAGEVTSKQKFTDKQLTEFVHEAVNRIGYTAEYQSRWGVNNTIAGKYLIVVPRIGQQSGDIARGVEDDGWGDQGIFFGYAAPDGTYEYMPADYALARRICKALFENGGGGLDIKTQVVMDGDKVKKVIAAVPILRADTKVQAYNIISKYVPGDAEIIINGTGQYIRHSTVADCGTTGRKLVVDFYGGASRVGGGAPWTKDGSKADLTLNLYARYLARIAAKKYNTEAYVSLACCIGKADVDFSICDAQGNILDEGVNVIHPSELIKRFNLDTPIYASMCEWGLFGEYQKDKAWEQE
ncbi:MAG: methionine adenosyltransferase domain-containing protein [Prevotella sp.]|nr:methionine adenosyltransferase domain-containing protein [Prevotella sp.]